MDAEELQPGQAVVWRHVPRGGYGFCWGIAAEVVKVGAKRVLIRVRLRSGALQEVWVTPARLQQQEAPAR
jgi:hypothetical protein